LIACRARAEPDRAAQRIQEILNPNLPTTVPAEFMGLAPIYNTIANAQNGVNVLNGGGLNFATNVAIPETPLSSLNRQRSVVAEFQQRLSASACRIPTSSACRRPASAIPMPPCHKE
jgi:hypothetical protein